MDSVTHILLGAVLGEVIAGKTLGKRAMFLGAVIQSLPDIDIIASFWLPASENLMMHRGITHSILFGFLTTIILAIAASRWHRTPTLSPIHWIIFIGVEIFSHLFIDAFNNYGVGWFEPFSQMRISFHTLFVGDPLFSLGLLISFIALLVMRTNNYKRKQWAWMGIILSFAYAGYAIYNKSMINEAVKQNLIKQNITYKRFFSTPTPLNTWLWFIVVEDNTGFYTGYRSVFDQSDTIAFNHNPRHEELLGSLKNNTDLAHLQRFSQGYYTITKQQDSLVFNDLRFGRIMGWNDPDAPFVFHYYLQNPDQNLLVMQRGRFTGWNKESATSLVTRISGK